MTTFDDRERGFESKFAHDQDLDDYAKAVVKSDFEQPGDEDVLRKVFEDLKGSGVATTEGEVRMKMAELLAQAREDVRKGK